MAELDNLLGSRISLISQVDVRYDGILFSINAKESSIVLKDVRCLGTEERVDDSSKKIPASHGVLAFVAFPGSDIKDLYLHDYDSATPEPAAPAPQQQQKKTPAPQARQQQPKSATPPQSNNAVKSSRPQSQQPAKPARQPEQEISGPPARAAPPAASASRGDKGSSGIGTGEHLLHLRVKKNSDQNQADAANAPTGVFDFAAALSAFNKSEVMESVAQDPERSVPSEAMYKKDDFFDSLSCDMLDREMGRRTHMTNSEERHLNQDTFGAVALQNNYSRGRGRHHNGGGRGGNHGRGQGQQGRGRGGSYRGGSRGGGRGGHRGGRGTAPHNAASA